MSDDLDELPFALEQVSSEEAIVDHDLPHAATSSSQAYNYLEEGHIRLLRILPREDLSDDIFCTIDPVVIDKSPSYTALSYAWGTGPSDCRIFLNGFPFFVKKNLWRFLRQAQDSEHGSFKLFWIDALSINQSNNDERTRQVRLMPRIYATANVVRMWLGPCYENSDKAIQELRKPPSSRRHHKLWSSPSGAAIRALCFRPYWTRLWIFQELMLAKDIEMMCGSGIVRWNCFRELLHEVKGNAVPTRVRGRPDYQLVLSSSAMSMFEPTVPPSNERTLFRLLTGTQHLQCAEIRDRVYALLGIAIRGQDHINADYDMPIPALLNIVLWNEHNLRPPKSTEEVTRQCKQLTSIFGLPNGAIFELIGKRGEQPDSRVENAYSHPSGDKNHPITLWWTSFFGHKAVQDLLFEEGLVDIFGLHRAANDGDIPYAKLLLDTGKIDINQKGFLDGDKAIDATALHRAAERGHAPFVAFLLDTGRANVNQQDFNGTTALHVAAKWGHKEVVDLLVRIGNARIDLIDDESGRTAFHEAVINGYDEVAKILLETNQININEEISGRLLLHHAARFGHEGVAKLLLDTGTIHVGLKDRSARTALHWGVRSGHEGIVKLLLRAGALNFDNEDRYGETPLHYAAVEGNEGLVRLLLVETAIDVNACDTRGKTPLHRAADYGYEGVVKLLLDTGRVDVSSKDEDGNTSLDLATMNNHEGVVHLLLMYNNANEAASMNGAENIKNADEVEGKGKDGDKAGYEARAGAEQETEHRMED